MTSASAPATAKLYTPRMLMLSARLADFPLVDALPLKATARSKTCGSAIELALETDADGLITRIGMQVTACAVGQSSAAILANAIAGKSQPDIAVTRDEIANWLSGKGSPPDWPDFDTLHAVREYTGRHGALLLPWNAAIDALSSGAGTS